MSPRSDGKVNSSDKLNRPRKKLHSNYRSPRGETGADVAEEVLKVRILPDTDRYFQIGTSMND